MYRLFVLILLFLLIAYVYMFLKIKKNKMKRNTELSYVEQYRRQYKKRSSAGITQGSTSYGRDYYARSADEIQNYITKYNSPIDYVEKGSFDDNL